MKRTIQIELAGKTKELNYPNNGQLVQITSLRRNLSYGEFQKFSNDFVDKTLGAFSFWNVVWPEILKENGLEDANWLEKDITETYEFVYVYEEVVAPWMTEVEQEITRMKAELDKKYKAVNEAKVKIKGK